MKALAIVSVALAIAATAAAHAQPIPQGHDAGGPLQQGRYCWVYTATNGAGWWDHCDSWGHAIALHGREDRIKTNFNGGGAGGGGNR